MKYRSVRNLNNWQCCLLIVFSLLLAFTLVGCDNKTSDSEPKQLPESTKATLYELIELARSLKSDISLSSELQDLLRGAETTDEGCLLLAHAYVVEGDYQKGIKELTALVGRPLTSAKVHYILGDVYYDLAILDMVNRNLYIQTPIGFLLFKPDNKVIEVFQIAKKEFDEGIRLGLYSSAIKKERIKQIESYLSGTPTEVAVTEDQAKAGYWLVTLSSKQPQLLEVAKCNLNAFRWVKILQQTPFIADPLVSVARSYHLEEIDNLKTDLDFQLRGVHDLACAMSSWTIIWSSYKMSAGLGSEDSYAKILKPVGDMILEYTDLLDLTLQPEVKEHLRFLNNDLEVYKRLILDIETQLEAKHSYSYRQIYALVYTEALAVTYLNNPDVFGESLIAKVIPSSLSTLNRLAQEVDVDPNIKGKILELSQRTSFPTTNEVVSISDQIFLGILASLEKKR